MKNRGLNLELEKQQQSKEDYVYLGATSPICIASIPESERENYLPVGEVQRGIEDTMDCASRAPVNVLETKFTWLVANKKLSAENTKWLYDNGYIVNERVTFSDAFVAINSNTTRNGNSLIAPLDAIHNCGLIPKHILPLEKWMTFDDYHDTKRITPAMIKLGEDFKARFPIIYERVYEPNFGEVLEHDIIDSAGFAWPQPINGEYPRSENPATHAFMLWKNPKYYAFDNYEESPGDFIKKLAPDYDLLDFGYRVVVAEKSVADLQSRSWPLDSIIQLFKALRDIIRRISRSRKT